MIVAFDCAVVRTLAGDRQLEFSELEDSGWGWHFERRVAGDDEPTFFRVSSHFILRIGLECLSLRWVLENMSAIVSEANKLWVDGYQAVEQSQEG